nr:FkbM family methyltransferase [Neomicrococcus lactis]
MNKSSVEGLGEINQDLTKLELNSLHNRKVTIYGVSDDHITKTIQESNTFYEWFLLTALQPFVSAGGLVVDVGANIGNHSIYFAASKGAKVVAFEPQPQIARILQRNIEVNFLDNLVEIRRCALGEARAVAHGQLSKGNFGATKMILGEGDIQVSTLDDENFNDRVRILKVDAEGMDLAVLRGGESLIERDRPVISCEVSSASDLSELTKWVGEVGYTFAGKYNATPTFLLLPFRSATEIAAYNRYVSTSMVNSNLMARDQAYRINVLASRVSALEERIKQLENR